MNNNLIKVHPHTMCKDRWSYSHDFLKYLNTVKSNTTFINFKDNNHNAILADVSLHQQSFLNIITETVFDYPRLWISEKSTKAIATMRPFVLVSSPGSLEYIRSLGFCTFSKYWDESYDCIADPNDRYKEIFKIITDICNKSIDELKLMLVDMEPILVHNLTHYRDQFSIYSLKKFEDDCLKNLEAR